jgi:hypothetical protein
MLLVVSTPAWAFKPRTHIWVGQQVLNDVLPDGQITIAGREYSIPAQSLEALRSHPGAYRMGHIGPDAYPDIVVGQMTVHPGIAGGMQTDDWLEFLLDQAQGNPEHLALALGFLGHAAGDVFAHTYVNAYSGDIFELLDGEQTVERRHFALESWLEKHTPAIEDDAIHAPAAFIRDTLILSETALSQYRKVPATAPHLLAMNTVLDGARTLSDKVKDIQVILKSAVDLKTALMLKIATETTELQKKLDPLRLQYETAAAALEANDQAIEFQVKALEELQRQLSEAEQEISSAEELIRNLQQEASGVAHRIADVHQKLLAVPQKVVKTVCKELLSKACGLPIPLARLHCTVAKKTVCNDESVVNQAWSELNGLRSGLERKSIDLAAGLADARVRLQSFVARKVQIASLRAATEVRKKELELLNISQLKPALDDAYSAYQSVRNRLIDLAKEATEVSIDLTRLEGVLTLRVAPLKILADLWQDDLRRAIEAYADASTDVARRLVEGGGSADEPLRDWLDCWLPVFRAVPSPISRTGCFVKHTSEKILTGISDLRSSVAKELGLLGWLIDPVGRLEDWAMSQLEQQIREAAQIIANHVLGAEMGAFLGVLADGIDDSRLNDIFMQDTSGKGLLLVPGMAERVRRDAGIAPGSDAPFQISRFPVAWNAVQLAKLSLLDTTELNRLMTDLGAERGGVPTPALYYETGSRPFSMLFNAVRSIDGNHQWMETAPPYPRAAGARPGREERSFGRPGGWKLWSAAPAGVFEAIFKGPLSPAIEELLVEDYPYACSNEDPFSRRSGS